MAEYIEREAALIICEKEYQERVKMQDWCGDTVAWNIGHAIKAIRPADVAPVVHGEWIVCGDGEDVPWMCSHCGKTTAHKYKIMYGKFCPNCGARMDGE